MSETIESNELRELYQEFIIDHGRHPRNFKLLNDADYTKEGFNPLCGDRLTLFLRTQHDVILDACFQGSGCAISMASASMMTEALHGKSFSDVEKLFHAFHQLLTAHAQEGDEQLLGKLSVLKGVTQHPSRIKCATLAWHTMMAAIERR